MRKRQRHSVSYKARAQYTDERTVYTLLTLILAVMYVASVQGHTQSQVQLGQGHETKTSHIR